MLVHTGANFPAQASMVEPWLADGWPKEHGRCSDETIGHDFVDADADGSATVSRAELATWLRLVGVTDRQERQSLAQLAHEADEDSSRALEWDEFAAWHVTGMKCDSS